MSPRSEHGSSSTWALALLGVLASLAVLLAGVGNALVAVRRAQAAADLAALAGAAAQAAGQAACPEAARVARRNETRLSSCVALPEGDVRVVVSTTVRGPWPQPLQVRGRARAGPAP
ncbi:MAG TPA: Rv3654c family TadE-like protein [Nocardioides sp.]|nr:Rv3654c family TadE-like protein [Nocardioides sp.]